MPDRSFCARQKRACHLPWAWPSSQVFIFSRHSMIRSLWDTPDTTFSPSRLPTAMTQRMIHGQQRRHPEPASQAPPGQRNQNPQGTRTHPEVRETLFYIVCGERPVPSQTPPAGDRTAHRKARAGSPKSVPGSQLQPTSPPHIQHILK